jgi:hypothetical protein
MLSRKLGGRGMTRAQAEAHYAWAFPGLSEKAVQLLHWQQDLLGRVPEGPKVETGWFVSGDDFVAQDLEPRAVYLSDKETGATVLFQSSINQIFATRGLGKSIVTNALLKCLIGAFERVWRDGPTHSVESLPDE